MIVYDRYDLIYFVEICFDLSLPFCIFKFLCCYSSFFPCCESNNQLSCGAVMNNFAVQTAAMNNGKL